MTLVTKHKRSTDFKTEHANFPVLAQIISLSRNNPVKIARFGWQASDETLVAENLDGYTSAALLNNRKGPLRNDLPLLIHRVD